MYDKTTQQHFQQQLAAMEANSLTKRERIIASPQAAKVVLNDGRKVLNMCANNYLGLANHPEVIAAASAYMKQWGYGLSSVRFICGTQQIHKQLEVHLSAFLGMDDTILYSSCFDANGGLFETILGEQDAIISDELNHASIIDGIRLCKAKRFRYKNACMDSLETCLKEAAHCNIRAVVTDGVFSMDGYVANLPSICDLAYKYNALVIVDESHSVGVLGEKGRGTINHCGVDGRVDITTGTLGKALGGATGGYTSGRQEIIDMLRQRSRPNLFSNALPPTIVGGALKILELLQHADSLLLQLRENTTYFRKAMTANGFAILEGRHPIVPVMLGDAQLANAYASRLLDKGIYVVGFSYPVVPKGKARIRVQISAVHTVEDLDMCINAFVTTREEMAAA